MTRASAPLDPAAEPAGGPAAARPPDRAPAAACGDGRVVLVTGPSGAGRSTAIHALEDLGFEVIDNLPLSLLPRVIEGPPLARPLALGLDVRNRDWREGQGAGALLAAIDRLAADATHPLVVLYLDCQEDALLRRYAETRRRHPLAGEGPPEAGIARERALLAPVRERADHVVDTTALAPRDLGAAVERLFVPGGRPFGVSIESFSYKRGLPPGLDMVLDCRFLRNPHWDEGLRALDGRDAGVAAYVAEDPRLTPFLDRVAALMAELLPGYREAGKAQLAVGLGCTGGQHRSVLVAERLANALAAGGWQVSKRHRELERRAAPPLAGDAEHPG